MKKALAITLALALCTVAGCSSKEVDTEPEITATAVSVVPVKSGTVTSTMDFTGNLAAKSEVIVTVATPGKVLSSNVGVGTTVKKGDLLFAMDSKDVAVQKGATQAQYDAAKASAEYTNKMISDTKSQLSSAKDTKAQLEKQLETMTPAITTALAGNPAQAAVVADLNAKRYSAALTKLTALQLTDPIVASFEALVTSHGELTSGIAQLESSVKSLEGQKIQADGQVNVAKEGLKAIDAQISNFKVYAPISGIIGSYNIQVGSYPTSQIPLTIVNMDSVTLTVNMLDTQVGKTKIGDEVKVVVDALDGKEITGKVTAVAPSPDLQTSMYPVTIEIANENHEIKPGFFVKAAFPITQKENTLYIPVTSVQTGDDSSSYVYVNDNGTARKKTVTTGIQDTNGNLEVASGVEAGELIITTNLTSLRDGAPVFSLEEKGAAN